MADAHTHTRKKQEARSKKQVEGDCWLIMALKLRACLQLLQASSSPLFYTSIAMCTGNNEWAGFPSGMRDEIPAGVHDDEREREEKKDERGVASGE